MPSTSIKTARVGVVVVVATAVLMFLIFRLTSDVGILGRKTRYYTQFSTTLGLTEGAEVRFRGVTVGTVEAIEFDEDPASSAIVLELTVRRSVAPRIDEHVEAQLRSTSPLGDKFIELRRPDAPLAEPLDSGAFIPSRKPFEFDSVVDEGTDLLADITSIANSLSVITTRLVAGEGLFGRLLKDKEFGERTLTDLEITIARLREIVVDSADGKNVIGKLAADEKFADSLATSLDETMANLATISERISEGHGPLGQMLDDESQLSQAVEDFGKAAHDLRDLTQRIDAAEGTVFHSLMLDEEYGRRVSQDFADTLHHVANIARKLDEGDGSAGMLLNDRQVYDGLNDIISGIESSWFLGKVLGRKQKRGFRERVEHIRETSDDPERDLLLLVHEMLDPEGKHAEEIANRADGGGS